MQVFAGKATGNFVERVTLNGSDVTRHCIAADDEAGWVDLVLVDPQGRPVMAERGGIQIVHVTGRVGITLRAWRCPMCGEEFGQAQQLLRHWATRPHAHPN